jgi:N-acyl-D-aspartate/D-glutamate deacylase
MLDFLLQGGTLIDGTGAPGTRADVGIRDGKIASLGSTDEAARETIDVAGRIVCPGFIDPHTHYDAQLLWDPLATPSNVHGVTTVIAGNCGFSIAPLVPSDADYTRRMLAVVEGMPLDALEAGLDWNWTGTREYFAQLEGAIGVNAGSMVGHCAVRRGVMADDAVGKEATPAQIDAMARLLRESLEAGGLGLSTSLSFTHTDGDGQPVPSRWASREEILSLCGVLRDYEGTGLELVIDGCSKGFTDDEVELISAMSVAANRVVNWNVMTIDSSAPYRYHSQIGLSQRAREKGARVVALTMPVQIQLCMSFGSYCAFNSMPGWGEILSLPLAERMEKLRDPAVRRTLDERARSPEAGVFAALATWGRYRIGETFSSANEGLAGRRVGEVASERGATDFDTIVDIALADDLRTPLWPADLADDDATWKLRTDSWEMSDVVLGGSDAGAHLDRMCGAPYTTMFLEQTLRGRQLVPIERAVKLLTQAPAELFGLRERGVVREGYRADLVVFDPESIGSGAAYTVDDLPGNTSRLVADAKGVERVFVNGIPTVVAGVATGARPGTLLRSGRDTSTVAPSTP